MGSERLIGISLIDFSLVVRFLASQLLRTCAMNMATVPRMCGMAEQSTGHKGFVVQTKKEGSLPVTYRDPSTEAQLQAMSFF